MAVKYVNQSEVPDPIFKAITDPYYSDGIESFFNSVPKDVLKACGDRQFSATTLNKAPRQVQLQKRHSHKITLDVLAGYWKMWGHVVHSILEEYAPAGSLIEQRAWVVVDTDHGPTLVHGQADLIIPKEGILQDYKVSSPYAVLYGEKEDYHAQLNILAWILMQEHGRYDPKSDKVFINEGPIGIEEAENIFLFKNLDRHRIRPDDPTDPYPKKEVLASPVPIWPQKRIDAYIEARLGQHLLAAKTKDDSLPFCTAKERWERPPVYKVYKVDPKTGRQSRSKHNSEVLMEARDWINENKVDAKGKPITYEIVPVAGDPVLCSGFCEVSEYCNQRQDELKAQAQEQNG